MTLGRFGHFEHGRSCTLWLDPESPRAPHLHACHATSRSYLQHNACSHYTTEPEYDGRMHSDAELVQLQAALQAAFPQCTDLSDDPARGISAFRPHLSLGQWRSAAEAKAAQQALAAERPPLWNSQGSKYAASIATNMRSYAHPFPMQCAAQRAAPINIA